VTAAKRVHGGPDAGGVPRHDFSTNSNACGPCPAARDAVADADATHYPDPSYTALRGQLAGFHGVAPERVLLAASASEFIFRITARVRQKGGAVRVPRHSYVDYAQAAHANGLAVHAPADGDGAALHWACDPSSPLGQGLTAEEGAVFLSPHDGAIHVLDRAYEPLRLEGANTLTETHLQKLWQLWSPNKAMGLTGVRAAYVIAPLGAADLTSQLEQLCPSWPVGSHGAALLQAWVSAAAQSWLAGSLAQLRHWKARQLALCNALDWDCLPSDANFFIARPALPDGMPLQHGLQALRAQGIKLRDAASFGLPGCVRVSVQPPEAQDALHNAWLHITRKAT
jgi:histidinol-phosphate aminotransferase